MLRKMSVKYIKLTYSLTIYDIIKHGNGVE